MGWVLTLGVLGLLCVLAEVFLPGGVLGVLGFLLIGASVVMAYQRFQSRSFVLYVAVLVVAGVFLFVGALKVMPKTALGKVVFLQDTEKGYDVSVEEHQKLVGKQGIALSYLRPTGIAQIDGKRVNVLTEGEFIERNARIKVCELKDNQLVVRRIDSQVEQSAAET